MCGLYGFISANNKRKFNANTLMRAMGVAAQVRGTHATGTAYVDNVGSLQIHKDALPAAEFGFAIPVTASAAIGHTRYTTQGSEKQNFNNHPFPSRLGMYALAHNGVLDNDKDIQEDNIDIFPATPILTDTYAAVQLLDKYLDSGCSYNDAIIKMAEEVSGMFAFTMLSIDGTLHIVRNDSPVYLTHYNGTYLYGSTEEIVKAGMRAAKLKIANFVEIVVPEGTIIEISASGELSSKTFEVNWNYYNVASLNWEKYSAAGGSKWKPKFNNKFNRYDIWDTLLEDTRYYVHEIEILMDYHGEDEVEEHYYKHGDVDTLLYDALRDYVWDQKRKATAARKVFQLAEGTAVVDGEKVGSV